MQATLKVLVVLGLVGLSLHLGSRWLLATVAVISFMDCLAAKFVTRLLQRVDSLASRVQAQEESIVDLQERIVSAENGQDAEKMLLKEMARRIQGVEQCKCSLADRLPKENHTAEQAFMGGFACPNQVVKHRERPELEPMGIITPLAEDVASNPVKLRAVEWDALNARWKTTEPFANEKKGKP